MVARLLVSLVLALLLLQQPTTLVGAQSLDKTLAPGQQLMRRGEFEAASQFYADLADQSSPSVAARAKIFAARAQLARGDTDAAEATLQSIFSTYANSDQTANAMFTLAQVRRAAGDCSGALRALDSYEADSHHVSLGPYISVQRAQCLGKIGDWRGELATAQAGLNIEGGGPRLTRIELLERAAEASTKLGRREDAFDYYNRALELAGTRVYRAEMLFTTATFARTLGRAEIDRFRAFVVDYPDTPRAPGALDALVDAGLGATVSPLQAGTVRLNGKEYEAALESFEQVT
ncbi:MAG TPA: tetratricopeptide repeat protein, partial [Chloroflexota bacterium]|nr:tetratricopeptide repeat protein [Chloroflexota bacterium]